MTLGLRGGHTRRAYRSRLPRRLDRATSTWFLHMAMMLICAMLVNCAALLVPSYQHLHAIANNHAQSTRSAGTCGTGQFPQQNRQESGQWHYCKEVECEYGSDVPFQGSGKDAKRDE